MNNFVAFIPARGGSVSIPEKNIKTLAGKPLISWTVESALQCPLIDKVYVATDSSKIRECVEKIENEKLMVISRSKESASAGASTESAMLEFAGKYEFTNIVLIQATSPLLSPQDLYGGIRQFNESGADSLLSVVRQRRFIWRKENDFGEPVNYDFRKRPRRQDFDGFLAENGAFYITSKGSLLKTKSRISGNIALYEMDEKSYHEIDEKHDWIVVECLLRDGRRHLESSLVDKLKKVKLLAFDVDGVLTDSGMYYSEKGEELKKFNTRDGKGIEIVRGLGIKTAIITSEETRFAASRAKKLKIDHTLLGVKDKPKAIAQLAKIENINTDEIGYIGDDVNDHEALKLVGFSACPNDAMQENKTVVDYVCKKDGGKGCVREVCDLVIEVLA